MPQDLAGRVPGCHQARKAAAQRGMGKLIRPLGVDDVRLPPGESRDHLTTFSPEGIETKQVPAPRGNGVDAEPAIRPRVRLREAVHRRHDGNVMAATQILPHEVGAEGILKARRRGGDVDPFVLQQMQGYRAHVGYPHLSNTVRRVGKSISEASGVEDHETRSTRLDPEQPLIGL